MEEARDALGFFCSPLIGTTEEGEDRGREGEDGGKEGSRQGRRERGRKGEGRVRDRKEKRGRG